jgi:hypothetical protein
MNCNAELDRLFASTLYLMSCHAAAPCARIAGLIDRHLEAMARHVETGPLVRETCNRLSDHWDALERACPAAHGRMPCLLERAMGR